MGVLVALKALLFLPHNEVNSQQATIPKKYAYNENNNNNNVPLGVDLMVTCNKKDPFARSKNFLLPYT